MRRQRRRIPYSPVPDRLIRDLAVTGDQVRLWALLERYCGENETAWPGQTTLAEDLGRSVPSVQRDLRALRETGWIMVRRRRAGTGVLLGNEYVLIEDPDVPVDHLEAPAEHQASPVMGGHQASAVMGGAITGDGSEPSAVMGPMKEPHVNDPQENETPPSPPPAAGGSPVVDEAGRVFLAWVESPTLIGRHRRTATLTKPRLDLIRRRLRDGYDVETLVAAVQGWVHSPHHRGENDRGTVYDSLDVCLSVEGGRRAANLDVFAAYHRDPSTRPGPAMTERERAQRARIARREEAGGASPIPVQPGPSVLDRLRITDGGA